MALSLDIPKINITAEADDDDDDGDHNPLDISETLTDVEDLFEDLQNGAAPLNKRNKLKIILSDNGTTTDLEDFEASSDDEEPKIIEHNKPLLLTDLDLEAPVTEESYKKQTKNTTGKRRMKTEFATKQKSFYHSLSEEDKSSDEGVVTDTEAYETENDFYENIPDTELNLDAYKIDNVVADNITTRPSPPMSATSDFSDNGSSSINLAIKPAFLTQNSKNITDNEGGATDAEVICSDSDNGASKVKIRRRRRCHRKQPPTDSEDLYFSDDDDLIRRPKRKTKQSLAKCKSCLLYSENEDDEAPTFPLCKPIAKKIQTSLRIPDFDANFQTDVEDIEGDAELENDELLLVDEAALEQNLEEISSSCGQVKEEFLSIQNEENLRKNIAKKADGNGELTLGDTGDNNANTAYEIKFSPSEPNFGLTAAVKLNAPLTKHCLNLPLNTDDPLTDYENVDSSPDETINSKIPAAPVQEQGLTDEEVMSDGDDDDADTRDDFVEEIPLPIIATRNLILIKENDSFLPTVRILPLENSDASPRESVNAAEITDEETISDAEEAFEELYSKQSARAPSPALATLDDDGQVNVHENLMRNVYSPIPTDPLTDTEEVILENKQKRKRAPKFKFMYEKSLASKNTLSPTLCYRKTSLTDTEDETVPTKTSVDAHLTDTENIEYSGDDQDYSANKLFSVHMRELGGETVLLKEGSGPFSIIDKLDFNKFRPITSSNIATPATTDSEDVMASAEEEDLEGSHCRAATATPNHVHLDLDDMCDSQIQSDSGKKFDRDAPDEVMYLKGGGYSDSQTDTEYLLDEGLVFVEPEGDRVIMAGPGQGKEHFVAFDFENYSVAFECKEWDATGKPAEVAGQATLDKDAVQQALVPNAISCETLSLKPDRIMSFPPSPPGTLHKTTSYTQIDVMLDKMLEDVEEQEQKLFSLDLDVLEPHDHCVNTLELIPSSDALIEVPIKKSIRVPKKRLYETTQTINISRSYDSPYEAIASQEHDYDLICFEEPKHERTEIMSVPVEGDEASFLLDDNSLYEKPYVSNYTLEFIKATTASAESLNDIISTPDSLMHPTKQSDPEDHDYEPIDTQTLNNFDYRLHSSDSIDDDIWWEGTYRNLSVVPEEDEVSLISSRNSSTNKYNVRSLCLKNSEERVPLVESQKSSFEESSSSISASSSDLTERAVKAEVKLLVKTIDRGRENIEIRSVREFMHGDLKRDDGPPKQKSQTLPSRLGEKFFNIGTKVSNFLDLSKKKCSSHSSLLEQVADKQAEGQNRQNKPIFTLPRLFVQAKEDEIFERTRSDSKLLSSKELSKSKTELIATTNKAFPLDLDYSQVANSSNTIDLYANPPFYPAYPQHCNYSDQIQTPTTSPALIRPTPAYCDWLCQSEDLCKGKPTSTAQYLACHGDLSLIDVGQNVNDLPIPRKKLESIFNQTNAFILSESRAEPYHAQTDKHYFVKAEPITDVSKEKPKRGFFGTLRDFVSRSSDLSDSDSEKTPKKEKKKKDKKKKSQSLDDASLPPQPPVRPPRKPKLPTPTQERKYDDIPFMEAGDEPPTHVPPSVPSEINEVANKQDSTSTNGEPKKDKPTEDELPKTPKAKKVKTIIVDEKITKTFAPAAVEEDEFTIIVDPTKKESPKKSREIFTLNIDQSMDKIEKEILGKSPIMSDESIIKPIAHIQKEPIRPPRAKDHYYEDIDPNHLPDRVDVAQATSKLIEEETRFEASEKTKPKHKRKLFAKLSKSSKDTEESDEDSSRKEVTEKHDREESKEGSVEADDHKKSFLGLFTRKPKKDGARQELSETTLKNMKDAGDFLKCETENYEDSKRITNGTLTKPSRRPKVRRSKSKSRDRSKSRDGERFFGLFKKQKKGDDKCHLSDEAVVIMQSTDHFLNYEINKYQDGRPLTDSNQDVPSEVDDQKEATRRLSSSEAARPPMIDETVLTAMKTTDQFLEREQKNYYDSKATTIEDKEKTRMPRSKIKEPVDYAETRETTLSEGVTGRKITTVSQENVDHGTKLISVKKEIYLVDPRQMQELDKDLQRKIQQAQADSTSADRDKTKPFIRETFSVETKVIDRIIPVATQKETVTEKEITYENVPSATVTTGRNDVKPLIAKEVQVAMKHSDDFLNKEVDLYHDVRPIIKKETEITETSDVVSEKEHKQSRGLFGLFKSPEKEKEKKKKEGSVEKEVKPQIAEEVQIAMKHSDDFLKKEVDIYHDVRPIIKKEKEITETSDVIGEKEHKQSKGLFGLFKSPEKEKKKKEGSVEKEVKPQIAEEVQIAMKHSDDFLKKEVDIYHDVRTIIKKETTPTETSDVVGEKEHKQSKGLFGLFKSPEKEKKKKEGSVEKEVKPQIAEEVQIAMKHSDDFLKKEVDIYYDVRPIIKKETEITETSDVIGEKEHKQSKGLFGLFKSPEKEKKKKEGSVEKEVKPQIAEEVQIAMKHSDDFLKKEVDIYHDVRTIIKKETTPTETSDVVGEKEHKQSKGLFGLFKSPEKEKKKKEGSVEKEVKPQIAEEVQIAMKHSDDFLKKEVDIYHDVRTIIKKETTPTETSDVVGEKEHKQSKGLFGLFKSPEKEKKKKEGSVEKEVKPQIAEEVQIAMKHSDDFLKKEVDFYHDVRPIIKKETEITETSDVIGEKEHKQSKGLFGLFKSPEKEKKKKEGSVEKEVKPQIAEEVQIAMKHSDDFLKKEVDIYYDVRPIIKKETEITETSDVIGEKEHKQSKGLFGLFKSPEKEKKKKEGSVEKEVKPQIAEEVQIAMKHSDDFLKKEVDIYHDVRTIIKKETTPTETSDVVGEKEHKQSKGLFGLFKSPEKEKKKKEGSVEKEVKPQIAEEVQIAMKHSDDFLKKEVDIYYDVRPIIKKETEITETSDVIGEKEHKQSKGLFGLFKSPEKEKKKKEGSVEKEVKPQIAEEVQIAMKHSDDFLKKEVDIYHDVRTIIKKETTPTETSDVVGEKEHKQSKGLFGLFKSPEKEKKKKEGSVEKEVKPQIAEEVQIAMKHSDDFLKKEVDIYHDVRTIIKKETTPTETSDVVGEKEHKQSKGLFGLFKSPEKEKKKKEGSVEKEVKPQIAEEVQIAMKHSDDFLKKEVDIYHDVRPIIKKETEITETSDVIGEKEHKQSKGLFGLFKSPEKEKKKKEGSVEKEVKPQIAEEVQIAMKHSDDFLKKEVDIYHDVRPIIKKETTPKETSDVIVEKEHKQSKGLFGLFKSPDKEKKKKYGSVERDVKSKKKTTKKAVEKRIPSVEKGDRPRLSEEVIADMLNSDNFLKMEVEMYHDVRPVVKHETSTERVGEEKILPKQSKGIFGMFRRGEEKKYSEAAKKTSPVMTEGGDSDDVGKGSSHHTRPVKSGETATFYTDDMEKIPETTNFLNNELDQYEDGKSKVRNEQNSFYIPPKLSETALIDMIATSNFLREEVANFYDNRPIVKANQSEEAESESKEKQMKTSKLFSLFGKRKSQERESSIEKSREKFVKDKKKNEPKEGIKDNITSLKTTFESKANEETDSKNFLQGEVDRYHDVRPLVEKPAQDHGGLFEKDSRKTRPIEEDSKVGTTHSLQSEIFDISQGHIKNPTLMKDIADLEEEIKRKVQQAKFEADNLDENIPKAFSREVETDIPISASPIQETTSVEYDYGKFDETRAFLQQEITNYDDVKPSLPKAVPEEKNIQQHSKVERGRKKSSSPFKIFEKKYKSDDHGTKWHYDDDKENEFESEKDVKSRKEKRKSGGFFSMFSKSSEGPGYGPITYSPEAVKTLQDTTSFLNTELSNYEDARPIMTTDLDENLDEEEHTKSGLFSIFSKKRESPKITKKLFKKHKRERAQESSDITGKTYQKLEDLDDTVEKNSPMFGKPSADDEDVSKTNTVVTSHSVDGVDDGVRKSIRDQEHDTATTECLSNKLSKDSSFVNAILQSFDSKIELVKEQSNLADTKTVPVHTAEEKEAFVQKVNEKYKETEELGQRMLNSMESDLEIVVETEKKNVQTAITGNQVEKELTDDAKHSQNNVTDFFSKLGNKLSGKPKDTDNFGGTKQGMKPSKEIADGEVQAKDLIEDKTTPSSPMKSDEKSSYDPDNISFAYYFHQPTQIGEIKQRTTEFLEAESDHTPYGQITRTVSDYGGQIKEPQSRTSTSEANIDLSNLPTEADGHSRRADTCVYVTSPVLPRRAVSQKYVKGERPEVVEVKNVSEYNMGDLNEYTVTEPDEIRHDKIKKPLFHIESEDDETVSLKRQESKTVDKLLSGLMKDLAEDIPESANIQKPDSKGEKLQEHIKKSEEDVGIIERKLRDLDRALDSLEKDEATTEKKLKRVERKFERMASELLEEEKTDAKSRDIFTPEVEEKRETEFQRLVSQISLEEVSDFQKEYSQLWDENTFSKSDDWESKTPESQADVQELPKGEIIYMGPVNLNKDKSINQGGIEVDVIPIMKSPCNSPRPKKKASSKRPRSEMGFYKTNRLVLEDDRGSLPDIKTSSAGSLYETVIQMTPERFLGRTSSNESLAGSEMSKSLGSTESFPQRSLTGAVKQWLEKSSPFSSMQSISFAVDNISLLDEEDVIEQNTFIPNIVISEDQQNNNLKSGRKLEISCGLTQATPALTTTDSSAPQPKPRSTTKQDMPLDLSQTVPKPEKIVSPVRDDLLDNDEDDFASYSDRKKFWESVSKETAHKRMSLHEPISASKEIIHKKRTSVHEIGQPPIPKPRSTLQTTHAETAPSGPDGAPAKPRTVAELKIEKAIEAEKIHAQEELTSIIEGIESTDKQEKIMSEYQASFVPPSERKDKFDLSQSHQQSVGSHIEKDDSLDSDRAQKGSSQFIEHTGYISDSEDVENVISDSEIEDRVPQIRERQMSVFATPVTQRKSIYERSASLPTEDLYEVSRNLKHLKEKYEKKIKEDLIEEHFIADSEEEGSPERKTLALLQEERISAVKSYVDEAMSKVTQRKSLDETSFAPVKNDVSIEEEPGERTLEKELEQKSVKSFETTEGKNADAMHEIPSKTTNKLDEPQKYVETHVDKSEIEDSEKTVETLHDTAQMEDDDIPEITVTLSGKQRRISEESDEYPDTIEPGKQEAPKHTKDEESPVKQSVERIQDTVWEAAVETQPEPDFDEKVDTFFGAKTQKKVTEEFIATEKVLEEKQQLLGPNVKDVDDTDEAPSVEEDEFSQVEHIVKRQSVTDFEHFDELVVAKTPVSKEAPPKSQVPGIKENISEKLTKEIHEKLNEKLKFQDIMIEKAVSEEVDDKTLDELKELMVEEALEELQQQNTSEKKGQEDDASLGLKEEESDLGSEMHLDQSDSNTSDRIKSESHSEIEKIILDTFYHMKVDPEEAKKIASKLIEEIENELQNRTELSKSAADTDQSMAFDPEMSNYIRNLAETNGLDEREVELVESVLARRQRELAKLARSDTQASSMEITDEDLRYSGGELADYTHTLEQQMGQLEAEKVHDLAHEYDLLDQEKEFHEKSESFDKTDEKHRSEKMYSEDSESYEDSKVKSTKKDVAFSISDSVRGEKSYSEQKNVILEEDETISESSIEEHSKIKSHIDSALSEATLVKTDTFEESKRASGFVNLDSSLKSDMVAEHKKIQGDNLEEELQQQYIDKHEMTEVSGQYNSNQISKELAESSSKESKSNIEKKYAESVQKDEKIEREELSRSEKLDDGTEVTTNVVVDKKLFTSSSEVVSKERSEEALIVVTSRTIGDTSKDVTDTSSSDDKKLEYFPKERVILRKTKSELDSSSSSSNLKPDRRSGVEFEAYSSSGESHYQSFEQDSGRSRPCSSDVEGIVAAASSEYDTALTSAQEYSDKSHVTSTDYHTAISSLSSKESMKSLDSESSGNLASVEVSEHSETLVPSTSDLDGDILDSLDQQILEDMETSSGWTRHSHPGRQISDVSDSDNMANESIDISEEEQNDLVAKSTDVLSKMKRSAEMTFQPEPKILPASESPQLEADEKCAQSLDDGSILSMSVSSASSTGAQKTVIELSERHESSITASCGSQESLPLTPTLQKTYDMATSTPQIHPDLPIDRVTLTTSSVKEDGVHSASTQITSELLDAPGKSALEEPRKKGHRRTESTMIGISLPTRTSDMWFKEPSGEEKERKEAEESEKDVDEKEQGQKDQIFDNEEIVSDVSRPQRPPSSMLESELVGVTEGTDPIERPASPEPEDVAKHGSHEISSDAIEQEFCQRTKEVATELQRKRSTSSISDISKEILEKRDSHGKSSSTSSEKSSFEEAEAEAAFNMVAHISPAHKVKQIIPILEDEDAEKRENELRERQRKELEEKRAQIRDISPGFIPDITVTDMTPDSENEQENELIEERESEKPLPSHDDADDDNVSIEKEDVAAPQSHIADELASSVMQSTLTESTTSDVATVIDARRSPENDVESHSSDSFEMVEKPDIIDDFVVIEEVGKEAQEFDTEGKSVTIDKTSKKHKKHDEEIEKYLAHSAPTPLTGITGGSLDEFGFEFEESPPRLEGKGGVASTQDYGYEYDRELEANKKWIEQQFQGDQAAMIAAGYGYEMEFERGPLEDIKEEDINDFAASSYGSQKESGGSVKDSYSSTPDYDVLAGRKYFTRSGEQDDISMNSLQEFENLEQAMSLEMRKFHQGQASDSSSSGSGKTRFHHGKNNTGDDISVSSLKEFEGLEHACIQAHKIEIKAKEEEAMLAQIEEGQESIASESESCETAGTEKKVSDTDEEEDYEKRMFEIDQIIKQAQSNVEKFIDLKEIEKTESLGRGDSVEEVSKVPDLELDTPLVKSTIKVQWKENEDVMITSTDSLDFKLEEERRDSTDSLDVQPVGDVMTASADSIEFQAHKNQENIMTDSIEIRDEKSYMISSDSLELGQATSSGLNVIQTDSIEEDGSRIGGHDHSSASTGRDFSSSAKEEILAEPDIVLEDKDDMMLRSIESIDPTSSTATHATMQYETDSVFSGSFTSGGSNTMVSSTDTIDHAHAKDMIDVGAAARKVWFDDDFSGRRVTEYIEESSKPYVSEFTEPIKDEHFSHIVHRKVELTPEVRKVTFTGPDADEQLRKFMADFNEGEDVQELQEIDEHGNIHTKRIVQKRFVIRGDGGEEPMSKNDIEEYFRQLNQPEVIQDSGVISRTTAEAIVSSQTSDGKGNVKTSKIKKCGEFPPITQKITGEEQLPSASLRQEASSSKAATEEAHEKLDKDKPKKVADQHQLSDEMKDLLKEMEKESKQ